MRGTTQNLTSRALALEATRVVEEKKAESVILLDVGELSVLYDYFLICTGDSLVHMKAIARALEEELGSKGASLLTKGRYLNRQWVLLDFGSLVVHIFSPDARDYYQLERLWADAQEMDVARLRG